MLWVVLIFPSVCYSRPIHFSCVCEAVERFDEQQSLQLEEAALTLFPNVMQGKFLSAFVPW